jgi:hypothetical protein
MINSLFRVSVVLGCAGMGIGFVMGVRQDFALVPAHAHLNLLGFVTLFLAALYYRVVPEAALMPLAKIHAATAILGAIAFPAGIAAVILGGPARFEPFVAAGATIALASMAMFASIVMRTSGVKQPEETDGGHLRAPTMLP